MKRKGVWSPQAWSPTCNPLLDHLPLYLHSMSAWNWEVSAWKGQMQMPIGCHLVPIFIRAPVYCMFLAPCKFAGYYCISEGSTSKVTSNFGDYTYKAKDWEVVARMRLMLPPVLGRHMHCHYLMIPPSQGGLGLWNFPRPLLENYSMHVGTFPLPHFVGVPYYYLFFALLSFS